MENPMARSGKVKIKYGNAGSASPVPKKRQKEFVDNGGGFSSLGKGDGEAESDIKLKQFHEVR
jgi:hypothetical protein